MMRALGLLLLLPLAGCGGGEVDVPAIEQEIEGGVREQTGQRVTVDCPDTIEWKTGGEFHCIAEGRQGQRGRITVTMENDEGEVIWELQPL